MQSNAARIGVLLAALAAALVLFVVLSGGDDDGGDSGGGPATTLSSGETTVTSAPRVITVKNGEPVGGVETLIFDKGDPVRIEVRLDRPEEEVHVHGYEIERSAETNPVRLSFNADIDGVFEIEAHRADGSDAEIAEVRVNP